MSPATKRQWLIAAACAVLAGFVILLVCASPIIALLTPTNARDNADPAKRAEMMRIILDVGDLAPIPKQARIRVLKTEGNMFTRGFRLVFDADAGAIRTWIKASPGMRTAAIYEAGNTGSYTLKARHDFQKAEVKIDFKAQRVTVYVSHS